MLTFPESTVDRNLREAQERVDRLLREAQERVERDTGRLFRDIEHIKQWSAHAFNSESSESLSGSKCVPKEHKPMHYFQITYEPRGGGDMAALAAVLHKMEAWTAMERVWLVGTSETCDALWGRLKGFFGKNDCVLIVELPAAPARQGWLPEKAWAWFNRVMPRGTAAARPTPTPVQQAQPKKSPPETQPPPEVQPEVLAMPGSLKCGFCGHEAPSDAWIDGECPRCGIRS